MKNVFVQMAIMAAAMAEAFRENVLRDSGVTLPGGHSRSRMPGKPRPAGAKLIMGFYKAKHGTKAESLDEARTWYAGYLAAADAKVRAGRGCEEESAQAINQPRPRALRSRPNFDGFNDCGCSGGGSREVTHAMAL